MNTDSSQRGSSGLAAIVAAFAEAGWPTKVLGAVLMAVIIGGLIWVAVLIADALSNAPTSHPRPLK